MLKSLTSEIIETVSFSRHQTEQVAGVLSFVLDFIRNDDIPNGTKEDSLRRYLSKFQSTNANKDSAFSYEKPVARVAANLPGNMSSRLKSSVEIGSSRSKRHKTNQSTNQDNINKNPPADFSQDSSCSPPISGTGNKGRSCLFCGARDHAHWSVCKVSGHASKLRATVVEESLSGYRMFSDQLCLENHFVTDTMLPDSVVLDKIPYRCRHVIVVKLCNGYNLPKCDSQVTPYNPSTRTVQLVLLGKDAVEIHDYKTCYFHLRVLNEWITIAGSRRKIRCRVFHRLTLASL